MPVFGEKKLVKNDGQEVEESSLMAEGNVIGIYFSAHWCPPCRAFTPQLAEWYKQFKEHSPNGAKFEIIFVSSDRDETSFKEYFADMPWLALPYEHRDMKNDLSKKFKVSGIPTLVFVDGMTGKLLTVDGRSIVVEDTEGKDFPWSPKKFTEVIPGDFVDKEENKTIWDDIKADVIGLYFSAHWCGPCRAFTPQLVTTYNKLKEEDKKFEIIFISSDRDEDSMKEYLSSMPWLAIPFGDQRKKKLSRHFDVSGIPMLVIIKKDGEIITSQGRNAIMQDPEGKDYPWWPHPLNKLTGNTAGEINDSPSLIWFCGEDTESAKAILTPIAEKYFQDRKRDPDNYTPINFFYSDEDDEDDIGKSLRGFASLPSTTPLLVLLDIPNQKVFVHEGEVNSELVNKTITSYREDTLKMDQLGH